MLTRNYTHGKERNADVRLGQAGPDDKQNRQKRHEPEGQRELALQPLLMERTQPEPSGDTGGGSRRVSHRQAL